VSSPVSGDVVPAQQYCSMQDIAMWTYEEVACGTQHAWQPLPLKIPA
jgi:hypothetical protein